MMNYYYTAIISIVILAAVVMIIIIKSNRFFDRTLKRSFVYEYIILATIALCEWLNIALNGTDIKYIYFHYAVKCLEFFLTPTLPSIILLSTDQFQHKGFIRTLIWGNVIFQLVSLHFGWVFYMDSNNTYRRGPLYLVFVAIYTIAVIALVYTLIQIGKKYQVRNISSLLAGLLFAVYGVGLQLLRQEVKTSWLTVEIGLFLAYIYLNDMIFRADKLTSLLNRWCFERHLEECDYDSAILLFDIDSFKSINDTYGHSAGDEILQKVAGAIRKTFSREGLCYRIGGDEYSVILKKDSNIAASKDEDGLKELISHFNSNIDELKFTDSRLTNVAVGYFFISKGDNPREAFESADKFMYVNKEGNKNAN